VRLADSHESVWTIISANDDVACQDAGARRPAAVVQCGWAAQTPPAPSAPSNDDCLMCHGDKDSACAPTRTSVHVDAGALRRDLHGQMGSPAWRVTQTCHAGRVATRREARATRLLDVPPRAGGALRVERARPVAPGRAQSGGHLRQLPRQPRHPSVEGPRLRTYHLNPAPDVRAVSRQRCDGRGGPPAARQRRPVV